MKEVDKLLRLFYADFLKLDPELKAYLALTLRNLLREKLAPSARASAPIPLTEAVTSIGEDGA